MYLVRHLACFPFVSLYVVSFSSSNIFIIAGVKSLSSKSNIWAPQGQLLFTFTCGGHISLLLCVSYNIFGFFCLFCFFRDQRNVYYSIHGPTSSINKSVQSWEVGPSYIQEGREHGLKAWGSVRHQAQHPSVRCTNKAAGLSTGVETAGPLLQDLSEFVGRGVHCMFSL